MTRKLKTLGLALMAVFAFGAIAANAAQAVQHEFTSSSAPTVLTGESEATTSDAFSAGPGAEIKCHVAKFAGTVPGLTADKATLAAEYSGCEDLELETAATVDFEHCAYDFESDTTNGPGTTTNGDHAPVHLECAAGNSVKITLPDVGITFTIPAQTPDGGAVYTELGDELTVDATATGIDSTCAGNFTCDLVCGFDTACDAGTYGGQAKVKGYQDNIGTVSGTNATTVGSYHGVHKDTGQQGATQVNLGLTT